MLLIIRSCPKSVLSFFFIFPLFNYSNRSRSCCAGFEFGLAIDPPLEAWFDYPYLFKVSADLHVMITPLLKQVLELLRGLSGVRILHGCHDIIFCTKFSPGWLPESLIFVFVLHSLSVHVPYINSCFLFSQRLCVA